MVTRGESDTGRGGSELADTGSRWWIAVVYAGLVALIIPWYWPTGDLRMFLGFPLWSLASLGVAFATALFTAWVYWTGADSD